MVHQTHVTLTHTHQLTSVHLCDISISFHFIHNFFIYFFISCFLSINKFFFIYLSLFFLAFSQCHQRKKIIRFTLKHTHIHKCIRWKKTFREKTAQFALNINLSFFLFIYFSLQCHLGHKFFSFLS